MAHTIGESPENRPGSLEEGGRRAAEDQGSRNWLRRLYEGEPASSPSPGLPASLKLAVRSAPLQHFHSVPYNGALPSRRPIIIRTLDASCPCCFPMGRNLTFLGLMKISPICICGTFLEPQCPCLLLPCSSVARLSGTAGRLLHTLRSASSHSLTC